MRRFSSRPKRIRPLAAGAAALLLLPAAPGAAQTRNERETAQKRESISALRPAVTLYLRRVSLLDAVRYLCEVSGLHYRIEKNAVVISDTPPEAANLRHEIYPVHPSFLELIRESSGRTESGSRFSAGATRRP